MNLFFIYETDLPPDVGYPLFGKVHLTILFLSAAAIITVLLLHKRRPLSRRAFLVLAAAPTALILLRTAYILIIGQALLYELPLHLCSLAGFFCLLYELLDRTRLTCVLDTAPQQVRGSAVNCNTRFFPSLLAQVLYALCLPGALLALLFPNGTMYPPLHFITLESYLFHVLVILYILLRLADRSIRPAVRETYKSLLFLCVTVPPIFLFNRHFHTNYMFLNAPSVGSPLYALYRYFGYGGYLIFYALAAVVVIFLMNFLGERIFGAKL